MPSAGRSVLHWRGVLFAERSHLIDWAHPISHRAPQQVGYYFYLCENIFIIKCCVVCHCKGSTITCWCTQAILNWLFSMEMSLTWELPSQFVSPNIFLADCSNLKYDICFSHRTFSYAFSTIKHVSCKSVNPCKTTTMLLCINIDKDTTFVKDVEHFVCGTGFLIIIWGSSHWICRDLLC